LGVPLIITGREQDNEASGTGGREDSAPAYYDNGECVMAQIVPFIRSNAAFDPETINILSTAFENAWHRIETSNSRAARPAYSGAMREVVARHIIDMAQSGEREPIKLSNSAVEFLAANYMD
jgi:hypothetical protein